MSFNKITIVGNLGKDPELRYTQSGKPVCTFSVATNEKRKDKAGDYNNVVTWFRVTLWGRQAELVTQYLTKGNPIYVEGRLRMESYTDRDGKDRNSLEVNGTDMQFIGSAPDREKEEGRPYGNTTGQPRNEPQGQPLDDDDIPF